MKIIAVLFTLLLLTVPAMATQNVAFQPSGATISISVSSTSASSAFTANVNALASQMMLQNLGTTLAFCRWGVGAQTAIATDMPMAAGAIMMVTKGSSDTVACITSSSTTTVYATAGEGY